MDFLDALRRNLKLQEEMWLNYARYMTAKTGKPVAELALPTFDAWRAHFGLA